MAAQQYLWDQAPVLRYLWDRASALRHLRKPALQRHQKPGAAQREFLLKAAWQGLLGWGAEGAAANRQTGTKTVYNAYQYLQMFYNSLSGRLV